MATTREEYLDRGCEALAIAVERRDELIATGRAEQAAREAGCRTPEQVTAWLARFAPDAAHAKAS
jgi:hypothetical protein